MKKGVLLTGGSGFIGQNIKELWRCSDKAAQYELFAPSHKELELSDATAVRKWFSKHSVDAVIHSATKPGHRNAKDLNGVYRTNMQMFTSLYEAARVSGTERFLFLGSGSEFDMENYRPKMNELSLGEYIPKDDTGFSKYSCTRMMEGNVGFINVRFFGIFGKYEDYAIRFISNAIAKILFDLPITIKQDRRFDYVSVEDGIEVIERFLQVPLENILYTDYNITPDESVSLLEIAQLVREVAGKPNHPIEVKMDGIGLEYSGDNGRLKSLFPDLHIVPLAESVKRLYTWYSINKETLDKEVLLVDK